MNIIRLIPHICKEVQLYCRLVSPMRGYRTEQFRLTFLTECIHTRNLYQRCRGTYLDIVINNGDVRTICIELCPLAGLESAMSCNKMKALCAYRESTGNG